MALPFFPLYPADFDADTAHLTLEEDGAYNRLLRLMWRTPGCSVPDDPQWIAKRLRCDRDTFERVVAPVIEEFFRRKSGRLTNARLQREYEKADETYRRRSEAGKKGGRPKVSDNSYKTQKASKSPAIPGTKQPEPEPEPDLFPDGNRVMRTDQKAEIALFERFYEVYPKHVAKKEAQKSFLRALRDGVDPERIIAAAAAYARTQKVAEGFAAHPTTWLNQGRWDDDPAAYDSKRPGQQEDNLDPSIYNIHR